MHAGWIRDAYNRDVKRLPQLQGHDPARKALQLKYQSMTPQPYKEMLPDRSNSGAAGGNKKTNPFWNALAKNSKRAGYLGLVVAGCMDINRMATSDDKFHDGCVIVAEWAGAIAGGYVGVEVGLAIGTAICPGVGTIIGGILGGLIGAAIGGYTGSELGNGIFSTWGRSGLVAREN